MKNFLIKSWYQKNFLSYLLLPFSYLYLFIIYLRRCSYQLGFKKTTKFNLPIIIVGNLTVGGTGKTPLVIWLANFLREKNFRPGIISRGYGGKANHYPQWVTESSDPLIVGDEAILIARHTHSPMVVAPERVNAVQMLLNNSDCDVVISDDGLQHYALARDIEIIVIDGKRRFGNNFYLPAGPLRESLARLKTVDFLINNGGAIQNNEYAMQLIVERIRNLFNPEVILSEPVRRPIHAVAGIGNPQRFFLQLKNLGFNSIIEHAFPDHYNYKKEDLDFGSDVVVIMTEKDAVKYHRYADARYWYLPVHAELDENFAEKLLAKLTHITK